MIDTHCHLTDSRLGEQLETVLANARAAGVSRMITIGTGLEDSELAVAVCQGRPQLRCAIGVHPNYSHEVSLDQLPILRELQASGAVVALGEMGLDYHYDRAPVEQQKRVFEFQLALADELRRPVVIHCREATDDTLAMLRNFPNIRADFHCFTGSLAEARAILDAGYMLGFTGPVTFKKNDELRAVARLTPLDRLLVETDAPYLSPEPMRKQKVNEPALVTHVAKRIAEERGMSYDALNAAVEANAAKFFEWP